MRTLAFSSVKSTPAIAGAVAMAVALTMWSGFALSMRAVGGGVLGPLDLALLRFVPPLLALAPFIPSRWRDIASVRPGPALLIVAGSGLPFFFLAQGGAMATSAAHVGAFIPGGAPLFVALAYIVFAGRRGSPVGFAGLAFIGGGALTLVGPDLLHLGGPYVGGVAMLLGAGALWAAYTIGLRAAGLDPISAALLLSGPSAVMAVGLAVLNPGAVHLFDAPAAQVATFGLVQGIGVGVFAGLAYTRAISLMGPARSAAIGAFSPALTAIAAALLLGEALTPLTAAGVAMVTLGVILTQRPAKAKT